jgi:hypothetical protein
MGGINITYHIYILRRRVGLTVRAPDSHAAGPGFNPPQIPKKNREQNLKQYKITHSQGKNTHKK